MLFSRFSVFRFEWRDILALFLVLVVLLGGFGLFTKVHAQVLPYHQQDDRGKNKDEDVPRSMVSQTGVLESAVQDSSYSVGPGDILSVAIFADRFYSYEVPVSSDGILVLPVLGPVSIGHLTLAEVRQKITQIVARNFRSGEVTVTLVRARQIKVSITGAVQRPGVVTLPGTARVSEALEMAGGGIRDTTALRGIVIRRRDGSTLHADLTSFFRLGVSEDNPFLMGGDVVYFPRIDRRVGIFGAVNFEGHVDFIPGDRLYTCLRLAGGLRSSVFRDSVQIVRFHDDQVSTTSFFLDLSSYPEDKTADIPMQSGDLVLIRAIPKFQRQRLVVLIGEVKYPGSYPIVPGVTKIREVLEKAGGLTTDASLEEASITRKQNDNERDREYERLSRIPPSDMQEDEYEYFKARSRERVGQMAVNFKHLIKSGDQVENIALEDGDIIDIPIRKNYVRVLGRVNAPGNVIFRPDWSFQQYIDFCGGYGWRADDGDVRVIKARTGELVDASDEGDYTIEPGDAVWVPETTRTKFWEAALTTLSVLGQVAGIVGIVYAVTK